MSIDNCCNPSRRIMTLMLVCGRIFLCYFIFFQNQRAVASKYAQVLSLILTSMHETSRVRALGTLLSGPWRVLVSTKKRHPSSRTLSQVSCCLCNCSGRTLIILCGIGSQDTQSFPWHALIRNGWVSIFFCGQGHRSGRNNPRPHVGYIRAPNSNFPRWRIGIPS